MRAILVTCTAWLLLVSTPSWAHRASDAYLSLQVVDTEVVGELEIALRDLEPVLGLDANGDGLIRWGELRERADEISAWVERDLRVVSDGHACPGGSTGLAAARRGEGGFASVSLRFQCAAPPQQLAARYTLLADWDADHRALVRVEGDGEVRSTVLGGAPLQTLWDREDPRHGEAVLRFVREGVWHIWIGFDHVLFLLCLLLAATRGEQQTGTTLSSRAAWGRVFRLVTAFSVAHSLTLALGATEVVTLPSRWVESAIAASVGAAGLATLFGRRFDGAGIAFACGLVHGLGFAGVLGELDLPTGAFLAALFGFNVGVELGQLAIVGLLWPMVFGLRETRGYRRCLVPVASGAIAAVATVWFVERAFAIEWVPFL